MNTRSKYNEVYDLEEVDETVEELWIESNEGTLESVKEWLESSNKNEVSFIGREEVSGLHDLLMTEFKVELSVVWDKYDKNFAAYLVGKAGHIDDVDALRDVLYQSSSDYQVTTDFGHD